MTSTRTVTRPTTGVLRLRPTMRGRGFVVGVVDAAGPDTNGFAPKDRVAWRAGDEELGELVLREQRDVLGVPRWITDEQVVSYLGPGLIARALVRTRPFGRGDDVRVESKDPLIAAMVASWAKALGARIVDDMADLAIRDDRSARRAVIAGHGRLAEAAVEVFQAIRRGVFDEVPAVPVETARVAA